jgi:DNA invertase Pin-like site-specific DNA recombinase
MIYGYTRVSTKGQLDGNGLQAQEKEILDKYADAEIVAEQFTGAKMDRPELNNLLSILKKNDILVVTKLDRLARNTVEGIRIVEDLFNKGVSVHVLNIGVLENTSMGRFFLTTLLAVAEMERNMIIERTQSGKEIAKQNPNFREGRPALYGDLQKENALELLNKGHTYKEVEQRTGISKSTLIRYKRKVEGVVKCQ